MFASVFVCAKCIGSLWNSESFGVGFGFCFEVGSLGRGGKGLFSGFYGNADSVSFLGDGVSMDPVLYEAETDGVDADAYCCRYSDDDGEEQHYLDEVGLALTVDGGVVRRPVGVERLCVEAGQARWGCRYLRASGCRSALPGC